MNCSDRHGDHVFYVCVCVCVCVCVRLSVCLSMTVCLSVRAHAFITVEIIAWRRCHGYSADCVAATRDARISQRCSRTLHADNQSSNTCRCVFLIDRLFAVQSPFRFFFCIPRRWERVVPSTVACLPCSILHFITARQHSLLC